MSKELQTMRTCSVCGQKKPLMAFLELAGDRGHTYGDICAACRGAGRGRKKSGDLEAAEKSGGTSRVQIDNKAKVKLELERKEQHKHSDELNYEEKSKKEATETEKESETELRKLAEKKQRDSFLAQKAAAKTEQNTAAGGKEIKISKSQGFYQEKARVAKDFLAQAKEQQLGGKTHGLTPEYVTRFVSASGRSAESLFGQFLGQFLRNHLRGQATGQVLDKLKTSEEGKTPQQAKAKEAPKGENSSKEGESKENLASGFISNNLKRR